MVQALLLHLTFPIQRTSFRGLGGKKRDLGYKYDFQGGIRSYTSYQICLAFYSLCFQFPLQIVLSGTEFLLLCGRASSRARFVVAVVKQAPVTVGEGLAWG